MAIVLDVWLDINCPYCYLGKKAIERAVLDLAMNDNIEFVWRYFELDPSLPDSPVETKFEQLARKYNRDLAWARSFCESLVDQGRESGIVFDFENLKVCRSLNAHRALKIVERDGKASAFLELLFQHQFERGSQLSDWSTLSSLAQQLGTSLPSQQQIEQDADIQQRVNEDLAIAQKIGVRAVPVYVFNHSIGIEGVQSVEHFKQQLLALEDGTT